MFKVTLVFEYLKFNVIVYRFDIIKCFAGFEVIITIFYDSDPLLY